jgi:hypothetical protein
VNLLYENIKTRTTLNRLKNRRRGPENREERKQMDLFDILESGHKSPP